jgi:mannitol/fructose-specific phosphotransferase system IIA component (Ntr-type)
MFRPRSGTSAGRPDRPPMRLPELLGPDDLLVPLEAADKWEAIARLVKFLAVRGRVPEEAREELLELVLARERSMSTGMEHGVAIPHAAVDGLDRLAACMGLVRAEGGLPFEAIDARPTYIVVLLLIPRSQKLQHIRTLADIARVLRNEETRRALLGAPDAESAWKVLQQADPPAG